LLFKACKEEHKDIVKYLVEHGANIHKINNKGETSLFKACEEGNKREVIYLVEHGVDMHKVNDDDDETALIVTNEYGYKDIEKYLIEVSKNKKIK